MLIPYSTALTLARPPIVTHLTILLCLVVFYFQSGSYEFTESLLYYPQSWNPFKMLTSAVAHANLMHLFGNMIFYLAFAPALEILIGNKLKYIWIMVFISFAVGISYSLSVVIGSDVPRPSLGFSGVVMGMIGLSAYMMPKARIKVLWWYIIAAKTFYVPAWILAICYIGLEIWTMLTASDYGGVNVVAHVAGGIAGYLYGYLWLKECKEDTEEALAHEIKAMEIERKYGKMRSENFRSNSRLSEENALKQKQKEQDRFMAMAYQMVSTHRDSEAVLFLSNQYNLETPTSELETAYQKIEKWGPSRTLLCFGRLIIYKLDKEKRYGRAIVFIEKCQSVSASFILPEVSRTLYYAQMGIESGKPEIARSLLKDPEKRYAGLLNPDQCNHFFQKAR
jgi:membrane associated rhomboid family serine protease